MIEWITNNNLWLPIFGIGGAVVGGTVVAIRDRIFAATSYLSRRRVEGTGRKEKSEHTKNDLVIVRELTNLRETLDKPAFIVLVEQTELDDKVKKSLIEGWSEKITEGGIAESTTVAQSDETSAASEEEQAPKTSNWIQEVQRLFEENEPEQAESIFSTSQENSKSSPDEKRFDMFYYQYIRYSYGQEETALAEMEQAVAEAWKGREFASALLLLSGCYERANSYNLMEKLWQRASEQIEDPKRKTWLLCQLADALSKHQKHDEAINIMEQRLSVAETDSEKMRIYSVIASTELSRGDKETSALAQEKYLELAPDNRDKLFQTAYEQSNADMGILGLLNYQILLTLNPRDDIARNNFGALLGEFDLHGKQIAAYEQAAQKDNTLSMANISYQYIKAGFFEDARSQLDIARKEEDCHENVGKAYYDLDKKQKEEEEKWAKLQEKGLQFQKHCRNYASALFDVKHEVRWREGIWVTDTGQAATVTVNGDELQVKWQIGEVGPFFGALAGRTLIHDHVIEGRIRNRAVRGVYEVRKDPNQVFSTVLGPINKNVYIECFTYVSEDNSKWYIFAKDGQEDFKITLTRE